MKFIRRNGRVIPIAEKAAGAGLAAGAGAAFNSARKALKTAKAAKSRAKGLAEVAARTDATFFRTQNVLANQGVKGLSKNHQLLGLRAARDRAVSNASRVAGLAQKATTKAKLATGLGVAALAGSAYLLMKKSGGAKNGR